MILADLHSPKLISRVHRASPEGEVEVQYNLEA